MFYEIFLRVELLLHDKKSCEKSYQTSKKNRMKKFVACSKLFNKCLYFLL